MIYPPSLTPGDTVAIIAPAGYFNHDLIEPALTVLHQAGLDTRLMPYVLEHNGTFSGTLSQRVSDFMGAWSDPTVKALLCARGGYGAMQLLEILGRLDLSSFPKWLIGFSDISALHALLNRKGVASIHASMLKGLSRGFNDPDNQRLIKILHGATPEYEFEPHPYNHKGKAEGTLFGGNLSVLDALISTPYDMLGRGGILFIEDINEPLYKIERMLYQLRLNGYLHRLSGLIIGQFKDCNPDANHASVYDMIHDMVSDYDFPIVFDAPIGHVDHNIPLIIGAYTRLEVTDTVNIIQDRRG